MVHFFDLPREVRDMIYLDYVSVPGGYIYDFDSNALRGADGKPIDKGLMLTCKKTAEELKGLALGANVLHFSTFYSEEQRTIAGRFELISANLALLMAVKTANVCQGGRDLDIPDDVWVELHKAHPLFAPYLDLLKDGHAHLLGVYKFCGETPSVFRDFTRSAVRTILSYKDRFDVEKLAAWSWCRPVYLTDGDVPVNERISLLSDSNLEKLAELNPAVWDIPTAPDLEAMFSAMGKQQVGWMFYHWHQKAPGTNRQQSKSGTYRYSAAAVAIRFLKSISKHARCDIRSMVLNEDRMGAAFAECHGLGLIPYCKENLRLRIERRVDMWRTAFQTPTGEIGTVASWGKGDPLRADDISFPVSVWIMEALALEPAGMPHGSFSLVLDGDRTSGEIFRTVVQRDATWQAAVEVLSERGVLPPFSYAFKREESIARGRPWYICEGFSQSIQDIVARTSVVRCNFDVSHAWDVEQLIEEHKDWKTLGEWEEAWNIGDTHDFEPDPPAPDWTQMITEGSFDRRLPSEDENGDYEEQAPEVFGTCSPNGNPPSFMDWI